MGKEDVFETCIGRCYLYNGIREIDCCDEELADFYNGKIKYDLFPNQYLILKNNDKVDKYRMGLDGKLVKVVKETFDSPLMGKIKPRNLRQELYMDLLKANVPLTLVSSEAGCGKTWLATCYALQQLERREYEKILFLRNNVPIEGVGDLGILPGDTHEKLKGYFAYVSDIMNSMIFETYLASGKIEVAWLGDMRGRNISNSFVLVSEAQNLTKSLVKMIISRMGDSTRLVFDFDLEQIDSKKYDKDNGMRALIDSLAGNPLFGMVELVDVERSELAKLASLIK